MTVFLVIVAALISYAFGSISFAVLISKLFVKKDVRDYGSGNAGMTNVVRTAGLLPGVLTLLLDFAKSAIACSIGKFIIFGYLYKTTGNDWLLPVYGVFLCGIFCQLGHIFPVFFGFKGGKGVATTVGIMLICNWKSLVIALSLFIAIFLILKIVSVGSIIAAASLPITTYIFAENAGSALYQALLAAILSMIIIVAHRDNIVRIINGTEKPITAKKE